MRIRAHGFTFLAASLLMADLAASPTQAGKPAAPQAAATAAIQSQDTNIAGIVAELTDCTRKDGVLTIKVRLRNTSTATIEVAVFQALSDLRKFYVTAENKKYFILTDSEKAPLTPQADAGYPWLQVKIAAGGIYQWWAKYPAPPASAKTLTFYTPWTPPFEDVPIKGQ